MRDSSETLGAEKISFRRSCQKQFSGRGGGWRWPLAKRITRGRSRGPKRKRRTILNRGRHRAGGNGPGDAGRHGDKIKGVAVATPRK